MSQVIDRTVDHLRDLNERIAQAKTFGEALVLQGDKERLEKTLKASLNEINRFTRGWHYMPPS